MTTENLVTIDFDSELVNNNNEIDVTEKNQNNSPLIQNHQEIDLIPDVSYNNLEDCDTITGESQPLLGDTHITYNQFPGKKRGRNS